MEFCPDDPESECRDVREQLLYHLDLYTRNPDTTLTVSAGEHMPPIVFAGGALTLLNENDESMLFNVYIQLGADENGVWYGIQVSTVEEEGRNFYFQRQADLLEELNSNTAREDTMLIDWLAHTRFSRENAFDAYWSLIDVDEIWPLMFTVNGETASPDSMIEDRKVRSEPR